jgi:hypothetical protein
MVIVLAGALWTHTHTHTHPHPPQAVREAHAAGASLVFLPRGYAQVLERAVTIVLLELLADRKRTRRPAERRSPRRRGS